MGTLSDKNTATVRTGWNFTAFTVIAALVYKVTGWHVTVDDLLPFAPVAGVVLAAFYRLSRVISEKVPWVGYVLFGNRKTPENYTPPPPAE